MENLMDGIIFGNGKEPVTKERILWFTPNAKIDGTVSVWHPHDYVLSSMDIYAKQQSIAFVVWLADNDVMLWSKDEIGGDKEHRIEYNSKFYTAKEAYQMFVNSQL